MMSADVSWTGVNLHGIRAPHYASDFIQPNLSWLSFLHSCFYFVKVFTSSASLCCPLICCRARPSPLSCLSLIWWHSPLATPLHTCCSDPIRHLENTQEAILFNRDFIALTIEEIVWNLVTFSPPVTFFHIWYSPDMMLKAHSLVIGPCNQKVKHMYIW